MKASNSKSAIRFGGLNFSLAPDGYAWCKKNMGPHGYGGIFDFHVLMQSVWEKISGEDLVKRLIKGFKLSIENGHQY